MKTILVPVGGSKADRLAFETALAVAQIVTAHLELVHVSVTSAQAVLHTPHVEFARGEALSAALTALKTRAQERSATAERNVRDFCVTHKIEMVDRPCASQLVTARWRADTGIAMDRLTYHARHHDLVVMTRPTTLDGLPVDRLEALVAELWSSASDRLRTPPDICRALRHDLLEGNAGGGARGRGGLTLVGESAAGHCFERQ